MFLRKKGSINGNFFKFSVNFFKKLRYNSRTTCFSIHLRDDFAGFCF